MTERISQMPAKEYPEIFSRYVHDMSPDRAAKPHLLTRRFHGREVPLWYGYVHVDEVGGYVENLRLRFYLKRWQAKEGNGSKTPTTDEVYQIMVDAEAEEKRGLRSPVPNRANSKQYCSKQRTPTPNPVLARRRARPNCGTGTADFTAPNTS